MNSPVTIRSCLVNGVRCSTPESTMHRHVDGYVSWVAYYYGHEKKVLTKCVHRQFGADVCQKKWLGALCRLRKISRLVREGSGTFFQFFLSPP